MSDEIKVSELPVASHINNGDLLMIVQGQANKKAAAQLLLDICHPVGSLYWSTVSTSPATLFGGTWEQVKDKFILAAGDTYTAGNTGGEATHTLTTAEMPTHSHTSRIAVAAGTTGASNYYFNHAGTTNSAVTDNNVWSSSIKTLDAGSGNAHNNMPPYLVAYCWKRTA